MRRLDPKKLSVDYMENTSNLKPLLNRKYTLTHSDTTGDLFLSIGNDYDYDKITSNQDEVFATWIYYDDQYILSVNVRVDSIYLHPLLSQKRNEIFMKELPLALEAILYGDKHLLKTYKLNNAPIYINFNSIYPWINRMEYWGTPNVYK